RFHYVLSMGAVFAIMAEFIQWYNYIKVYRNVNNMQLFVPYIEVNLKPLHFAKLLQHKFTSNANCYPCLTLTVNECSLLHMIRHELAVTPVTKVMKEAVPTPVKIDSTFPGNYFL
ncbi:hypothetical protein L9F63_013241, partial [Diploptera punctata]